MKKILRFGAIFLIIFLVFTAANINFTKLLALPNTAFVSPSDVAFLNTDKTFGQVTNVSISDINVNADKKKNAKMWIKLFGIIPIRQIEVELCDGEEVYLGGIPLGFALEAKGLLVVGCNTILTQNGLQSTSKTMQVGRGDFLIKINDKQVLVPEDISAIVATTPENTPLKLTLLRNNKPFDCYVLPSVDVASGTRKLGLWVKNTASGIGTLTFVTANTNRFGALGHPITDYETGTEIPVNCGNIYKCNQIGITKAEKNLPGELRCVFLQGINSKGNIEKNTDFGVFGNVSDLASLVDFNLCTQIGSRLTIKTGKAQIVSSVSGVLEEYDIEIIKTAYQPESDDKSFIFRVTDKRLLEMTGGIVQGMSGSPIIQNGKLIGATTHVFVSDPTKGYGIYADWMINE